jgi:hypothetical protein
MSVAQFTLLLLVGVVIASAQNYPYYPSNSYNSHLPWLGPATPFQSVSPSSRGYFPPPGFMSFNNFNVPIQSSLVSSIPLRSYPVAVPRLLPTPVSVPLRTYPIPVPLLLRAPVSVPLRTYPVPVPLQLNPYPVPVPLLLPLNPYPIPVPLRLPLNPYPVPVPLLLPPVASFPFGSYPLTVPLPRSTPISIPISPYPVSVPRLLPQAGSFPFGPYPLPVARPLPQAGYFPFGSQQTLWPPWQQNRYTNGYYQQG